jgi:NAD-dependent deacetylase
LRDGAGTVIEAIGVILRALAQLVLAERPLAGGLVLCAMVLISPWIALGALVGAGFGTTAGIALGVYTREEWKAGLAGFNGSIIGILSGGFLASGEWQPVLLLAVLSLCVLVEWGLGTVCRRVSLPPLSMPAVLTAILVSLLLAPPGNWFWIAAPQPPLGMPGVHAAVVCVVLAASTRHQAATLQALLLGAAALFLAKALLALDLLDSAGLWAFAVAPASFATQAVLVPGVLVGALAGLLAGLCAGLIWLAWHLLGLGDITQPLLAPFVLATWLVLIGIRRLGRRLWLDPDFWRACLMMARARLGGRPMVALLGAEPSAAAGLRDYAAGSWWDPQLPASACSRERFALSPRCRRVFWEACQDLRDAARGAAPSHAHRALLDLRRRGDIRTTVTTTVDDLCRGVDDVIALFGQLEAIACIDCGASHPWPPGDIWRRWDLHCPACGGLLRPAVTPPGEEPDASVWRLARRAVSGCGVLLVIGCTGSHAVEDALVDLARRRGACIVFIDQRPQAHSLHSRDLALVGGIDTALRAFSLLLAGVRPLARPVEPAPAKGPSRAQGVAERTQPDAALRP